MNNVQSMTKMRENNYMINHIGPLYVENEIELWWPIWRGTIYDKDQTRQERN